MNDYLFNVTVHFVSVYLSTAIGVWMVGWMLRKALKVIAMSGKEPMKAEDYQRYHEIIRQVARMLVVLVLAWGAYSTLTHGAYTYKHNDVDDSRAAVQEMKDYRAEMKRGSTGEITLEGTMQPESSESRAERMKEQLDWRSHVE